MTAKCTAPEWRWLSSLEYFSIDGEYSSRTGDVENLLIVLDGTFDIVAGGGSWTARGIRTSPIDGKPVALFLPPRIGFGLSNGTGSVLLVSGIQPEQVEKAGEASSKRPLLALAGSGKAFDPASGEWKREEDFPSSPEAVLPRRIETTTPADGVTVRHVFPFGYKALCLGLDEIVLTAGCTTGVPEPEVPDYPEEIALYYEAPGGLVLDSETLTDRGFVPVVSADTEFTAGDADVFLALAYAGAKLV